MNRNGMRRNVTVTGMMTVNKNGRVVTAPGTTVNAETEDDVADSVCTMIVNGNGDAGRRNGRNGVKKSNAVVVARRRGNANEWNGTDGVTSGAMPGGRNAAVRNVHAGIGTVPRVPVNNGTGGDRMNADVHGGIGAPASVRHVGAAVAAAEGDAKPVRPRMPGGRFPISHRFPAGETDANARPGRDGRITSAGGCPTKPGNGCPTGRGNPGGNVSTVNGIAKESAVNAGRIRTVPIPNETNAAADGFVASRHGRRG